MILIWSHFSSAFCPPLITPMYNFLQGQEIKKHPRVGKFLGFEVAKATTTTTIIETTTMTTTTTTLAAIKYNLQRQTI